MAIEKEKLHKINMYILESNFQKGESMVEGGKRG
jgi:hypothetical protein